MYNTKVKEEELKNKVAEEFFADFDCRGILGNIDFSVAMRKEGFEKNMQTEYLLWAEAKKGNQDNMQDSLVQLIATIGKEKTFDKYIAPRFLGAFDAERIAFVPYAAVQDVFFMHHINWNFTPSNHQCEEFKALKKEVIQLQQKNDIIPNIFDFGTGKKELVRFIRANFKAGCADAAVRKIRISQNNFVSVYRKWHEQVAPTIAIGSWDVAKKNDILERDFYLADIMSENNNSIMTGLKVLLASDRYKLKVGIKKDFIGTGEAIQEITFRDNMKAHKLFWENYQRPPKKEYWTKIVDRQDLLVSQDFRERKGSYYTPKIWVDKSQEYLADVLGENWQEEYYIWDCCAGTGNLLSGLTERSRIWASELLDSNVKIIHEGIERGEIHNLFKNHVFQFDFLNDSFEDPKFPQELRDIIQDEEKRKKLVIYINPPYAEATNAKTITGTGVNKTKVARANETAKKYKTLIGTALNELFAQFFIRIYKEIPSCVLAEFSTLKILQAPNFADFRAVFKAKLEKMFIVPAKTFDNVKGNFPIGFFIWNTKEGNPFTEVKTDVYGAKGQFLFDKYICNIANSRLINSWINEPSEKDSYNIATLFCRGNDFQNQNYIYISQGKSTAHDTKLPISQINLLKMSVYLSVRHCIDATWLNDRDQFLYPNDGWQNDKEFQADCLAYALFHGQNRISSTKGTNHWIPFTENEMEIKNGFASHFMSDFIAGKSKAKTSADLFNTEQLIQHEPIHFSPAAQAVMDAGKAIWYYYLHHQDNTKVLFGEPININASFYDIREYFQGRDEKGRMNPTSTDETYNGLLAKLRAAQKILAKQIEVGVYKYGFLYNGETLSTKTTYYAENEEINNTTEVVSASPQPKQSKQRCKTIVAKSGRQTNIYNISGDLKIDTYIENKK